MPGWRTALPHFNCGCQAVFQRRPLVLAAHMDRHQSAAALPQHPHGSAADISDPRCWPKQMTAAYMLHDRNWAVSSSLQTICAPAQSSEQAATQREVRTCLLLCRLSSNSTCSSCQGRRACLWLGWTLPYMQQACSSISNSKPGVNQHRTPPPPTSPPHHHSVSHTRCEGWALQRDDAAVPAPTQPAVMCNMCSNTCCTPFPHASLPLCVPPAAAAGVLPGQQLLWMDARQQPQQASSAGQPGSRHCCNRRVRKARQQHRPDVKAGCGEGSAQGRGQAAAGSNSSSSSGWRKCGCAASTGG